MMKVINRNNKFEKAQILPLVVLAMFVLIAFAALLIDGAAIMSNRRTAQAAADAGAMAGAWELCNGTATNAFAVAQSYVEDNEAVFVDAWKPTDYEITVVSALEHPSFFAKILGIDTLKATADATAGCYGSRGQGVLPLAWNCHPTDDVNCDSEDLPPENQWICEYDSQCIVQTLKWADIKDGLNSGVIKVKGESDETETEYEYFLDYKEIETRVWGNKTKSKSFVREVTDPNNPENLILKPPDQIYIIGDTNKICIEDQAIYETFDGLSPGEIDELMLELNAIYCDVIPEGEPDGKLDIQVGGNRGWLYLPGANNLADSIKNPDKILPLIPHIWLDGKPGTEVDVLNALLDKDYPYTGKVIKVPVYNKYCDLKTETQETCVEAAHGEPWYYTGPCDETAFEGKTNTDKYHIITFAHFYVSCVSTESGCPGYNYARALSGVNEKGDYNLDLGKNIIEGFFIRGYLDAVDTEIGCNFGDDCTISLSD